MAELELASIAFNKPRLIAEQIRLIRKHLWQDRFHYTVVDNSSDAAAAEEIRALCTSSRVGYRRCPDEEHEHAAALNFAWTEVLGSTSALYRGLLDHDIFPQRATSLVPLIADAGFFGVGQRHPPTGHLYLWPGFVFFSTDWLADRTVDFTGIRGEVRADDGDTGSGMWPLFADEDWRKLYRVDHSYKPIREPDDFGLQSFGVEMIGDWLHLSNGSGWMRIPEPAERERLVFELLETL